MFLRVSKFVTSLTVLIYLLNSSSALSTKYSYLPTVPALVLVDELIKPSNPKDKSALSYTEAKTAFLLSLLNLDILRGMSDITFSSISLS